MKLFVDLRHRRAAHGVDRIGDLAQQRLLLTVREEGRLETLHGDALEGGKIEVKGVRCEQVLVGHRGVGDQAVVGADREPQARVVIEPERVLLDVADRVCRLDFRQISMGIRRSFT